MLRSPRKVQEGWPFMGAQTDPGSRRKRQDVPSALGEPRPGVPSLCLGGCSSCRETVWMGSFICLVLEDSTGWSLAGIDSFVLALVGALCSLQWEGCLSEEARWGGGVSAYPALNNDEGFRLYQRVLPLGHLQGHGCPFILMSFMF